MNLIAAQPDLFGEPRLAGLSQADAIVTPDEEQMLIGSINAAELSPFRFHGLYGDWPRYGGRRRALRSWIGLVDRGHLGPAGVTV